MSDSEHQAKAQFAAFAALCEQLATSSGRIDRARLVADYLATLEPDEAEIATRLLLGRAFAEAQGRRLTLGGAAVWQALRDAGANPDELQWAGAPDFGALVARAMPATPKMRHGVQEGTVLEALATLASASGAAVRRAAQALGDIGALARLARADPGQLAGIQAELFRPIKPMLAQSAPDVAAAWAAHDGRLALEWKLDGARVQIHKRGDEVRIFSRRLQELSASLPEIVAAVRTAAAAHTAIFEGEVLAEADGRPLPFQELMRRFRRRRDIEAAARAVPVRLYLFDLLRREAALLLDQPQAARWQALQAACGTLTCVARLTPADVAAGEAFYAAALAAGHEGVMAKALDAPYAPGLRGAGWLKIKRSASVDLVIVAAEWGYGRRHRWLSNYHLAARDPASGRFEPVGKTFKGPTDAEFAALTERLLALQTDAARGTVFVRPELVVEVKFDGVQDSPRYAGGLALRFARIVRVRDDKPADQADTLATLRAYLPRR
jgi:DNA ligase 1